MAGVQIDGVNNKIDFDDDQDTSISANTDDTLVIEAGGNTLATITATTFTINDGTTITTDDNSDNLTLISTDADSTSGPNFRLRRDSSSPADDDNLGNIFFSGDDSAGNETNYAAIKTVASDVTDGTEDGYFNISVANGGSLDLFFGMTGAETVINDLSKDHDFRVESDGNANMLFVDGGNNVVTLGSSVSEARVGQPLALTAHGGTNRGGMAINSFLASANGPLFDFSKSRNNTAGSHTVVQSGDNLGTIIARGDDGDEFVDAAFITFDVDGTPGGNDMPGRISFGTTADGANGGTERMRINSVGAMKLASDGDSLQGTLTNAIHSVSSAANLTVWEISSGNASYSNSCLSIGAKRAAVNSYNLIGASTGDGSTDRFNDLEFRVKGDGNVSCDESFTGSGADYSEYFEWSDGNSSAEDRVGISVKLNGNKIVASADSDDAADIIGVVSGSPVIVGDADGTGDRWSKKYEKDDYGRSVYETYTITQWTEVVDDGDDIEHEYHTDRIPSGTTAPDDATVISKEDDNTTDLTRRKLNSDYNSSLTYVARENRKEWDTVGLVGKLRMKKGQKTGTNWIKMRDISDTVEEWLVR